MKLLVDACTFLWILEGSAKLSTPARQAFLDRNNERFLSSVSAWEIAIKYAAGRLALPEHPGTYVPSRREAHGIAPLPLDEESALHAARLPRLHGDPFDRMLVAQALIHGLTVLTPDQLIAQYPVRVLW